MSGHAHGGAHGGARAAAPAACLVLLAACAASPPGGRQSAGAAAAPAPSARAAVDPGAVQDPVAAPLDASFEWRGLLLLPFGTRLQESPVPLHEVLLFHDLAQSTAEVDNRDCYGVDGEPPRFLGRQPDEYLLCFGHDRLNHIEATVRLAAATAADTVAEACARWLRDAPPESAPLRSPPPAAGNACAGRAGGISWSVQLLALDAVPALSITLTAAAERPPEGAALRGAPADAVGAPSAAP